MRSPIPEWAIVNDDWLIIVAFGACVVGLALVMYLSTQAWP